jgi:hypothetical protein
MIEQAIRTALINHGAVAALVSARVYPVNLPQATRYPAITYQTVSGSSTYSMDGSSNLANPRVQFDLYAETFDGLVFLKAAVMDCLSGFVGTSANVDIQGVFRVFESDGFEQQIDGPGPRVWRKTLDFTIWYKETY